MSCFSFLNVVLVQIKQELSIEHDASTYSAPLHTLDHCVGSKQLFLKMVMLHIIIKVISVHHYASKMFGLIRTLNLLGLVKKVRH